MNTTPWGELAAGPFAVGFRTAFKTDYGRHYGPPAGEPGAPRQFRPIFVAAWYPADVAATASGPMTYGDYLNVTAEDEAFASFAKRITAYVRDVTITYSLGRKPEEMDDAGRRELEEREQLPLRAVRDAPSAAGRFPVIVCHPGLGGSYEDNTVLCEYLASHGYVVVSSVFQPEEGTSLNLDWDLSRSHKDLSFLMNVIAESPQADLARVGAVGQSYGAQALLAWSSEPNCPLKAVVSLDSTVEYWPTDEPKPGFDKLREPLARDANITAAWLLFAVKQNNPNWSRWDYLTQNPVWFAATGPLGHDDFISQGLIGTLACSEDSGEAERLRQRYDAVCSLTRRFLDAFVKDEREAREALMQNAAEELEDADGQPITLALKPPSAASRSAALPQCDG